MNKNYDSLAQHSQHQDKWQKWRKYVLRHTHAFVELWQYRSDNVGN